MADDEEKCPECPPGAPVWMCTFADLMSLLMCFFVLLLSFATMDAAKYKQVAGSMKDAFGVQRDTAVDDASLRKGDEMVSPSFTSVPLQVQMQVAKYFSEETADGSIETEYSPEGLILRIKDHVAFDSGRAVIKKDFMKLLDKIGLVLQKGDLQAEIGGHTDNIPLKKGHSSFKSNWSLSAARSVGVVEYLSEKFNIPPGRLSAVGYAYGHPLATNSTAEGRAKNRRVEFKIRPGGAQVVLDGLEFERGIIRGEKES